MKKKLIISALVVITGIMVYVTTAFNSPPSSATIDSDYIVLAWNDLGMHCANADFSEIVILPPYNNFNAQVIKRGNASQGSKPEIVTENLDVLYSIPGNTYSVGKTNFWDYEDKLFGVQLPDNIGLAGKGLSGSMEVPAGQNFFHVEGVPITPFTDNDLDNEDPYQMAQVDVLLNGLKVASTQNVMPVSNEINCFTAGCHSSVRDIKSRHSDSDKWPKPVLCASCHSSNALAAPGKPGVMSLSEAMHTKHKDKTSDCYKCHPGPNTQCLRDVMSNKHNMSCTDCHGGMKEVSESIHNGRRPWIDEPKCGSCHGANFAEEAGQLYRNSKGHGGLFCTTCHGSPHAIVPSREENDNLQNYNLQGYAGTLNDCKVCHTTNPSGAGPHGIFAKQEVLTDADNDGYKSDVDCNDNDPSINPGAEEICDGIDNNCNGEIDEGNIGQTYYKDEDADGYSDGTTYTGCSIIDGYALSSDLKSTSGDCDDTDASINPEAPEICDGLDNNCNGIVDEGITITYYKDGDGDGYTDGIAYSDLGCDIPKEYVDSESAQIDCDDNNPTINPGVSEIKDNCVDENCDGIIEYSMPFNLNCLPLNVYPIPFSTYLTVVYSEPITYVLFKGSSAVLLGSDAIGTFTIDIPNSFKDGSYVLRLTTSDNVSTSINLVKKTTRGGKTGR